MRYFDGSRWTAHVASHGKQATDPPGGEARVPVVNWATEKVQADVAKVGLTEAEPRLNRRLSRGSSRPGPGE